MCKNITYLDTLSKYCLYDIDLTPYAYRLNDNSRNLCVYNGLYMVGYKFYNDDISNICEWLKEQICYVITKCSNNEYTFDINDVSGYKMVVDGIEYTFIVMINGEYIERDDFKRLLECS